MYFYLFSIFTNIKKKKKNEHILGEKFFAVNWPKVLTLKTKKEKRRFLSYEP